MPHCHEANSYLRGCRDWTIGLPRFVSMHRFSDAVSSSNQKPLQGLDIEDWVFQQTV